jgi:hypothetical protein
MMLFGLTTAFLFSALWSRWPRPNGRRQDLKSEARTSSDSPKDSGLLGKIEAHFARRNSRIRAGPDGAAPKPKEASVVLKTGQGFALSPSPVSFQNSRKGFVNHFCSGSLKAFPNEADPAPN